MKIYSGCGNTFIITMYNIEYENHEYIKKMCINVDGFIMVKKEPLEMIIYNKDASLATMCGNGIRCFINYCYDQKILSNFENTVITKSGLIYTKIINTNPFLVYVKFNKENYIYIDGNPYLNYDVNINNNLYKINLIECGVWHGVIIPDNFNQAVLDASIIRELPLFKDYLNVDLINLVDNKIYVKTIERGVGFTKACGTGVISSYLILKKLGIIKDNIATIYTDGGIISVGVENDIPYIIGPSEQIK